MTVYVCKIGPGVEVFRWLLAAAVPPPPGPTLPSDTADTLYSASNRMEE